MSTATDMLAAYVAAELAVLDGKTAKIGETQLSLEDLDKIRAGRQEWERKVYAEQAAAGGGGSIGGVSFKLARFGR
jgi:hypothetical protein